MSVHTQLQALNSMLDGAFLVTMVALISWLANSFYLHVLTLTRKPINPDNILSDIPFNVELAKHVLDDLIQHAKEQEDMKIKPVKKLSAIINDLEQPVRIKPTEANLQAPYQEEPLTVVRTYTIRQLKALASEQKVKGYSNMTKAQLLEVVQLPS